MTAGEDRAAASDATRGTTPEDEPTGLRFARTLRAAIDQRGLPLDRLVARLERHDVSISVSTLSKWQNGTSTPSGSRSTQALAVLERELGLPSGRLSAHLPEQVPRGPQRRRRDCPPDCALVRGSGLGLLCRSELDVAYAHVTFVVDDRAVTRINERVVVTARRSAGVEIVRTPCRGPGRDVAWAPTHALGCTVDVTTDPAPGWVVRPLDPVLPGQSVTLEWSVAPDVPVAVDALWLCNGADHREVVAEVDGPDGLSSVVVEERAPDGRTTSLRALPARARTVAAFTRPGAGASGLRIEQASTPSQ